MASDGGTAAPEGASGEGQAPVGMRRWLVALSAVAGGENEYTLEDFDRLLRTGAITYLQPEITKIGGLTAARRVSTLAELHSVALSPHNFRLGPALYASIQWGFTSPATKWLEIPWVRPQVGFSHRAQLPPLVDGMVLPPTGPGLGVVIAD